MTALQRAFSRHEKTRRMLANLEELKKNDAVNADEYAQLKTQYQVLLDAATENLKAIRNQIKEQRQQAQETLNKLQADASDISIRVKVGELAPKKVTAELGAIQSKKDACTKSILQCDGWLAARSSMDVGGYVDVDANETIEYRSESVLDWGKVVGNIGERAKGLVGEKVAGSVTGLVEQAYETAKDVRAGNLKKRLPLIIGVCVGVLVVVLLCYAMFGKRPSISTIMKDTTTTKVAEQASTGRASGLGDDADQIMSIAAHYQDSIRERLAGGATSVQRQQVVQSADQDFPAKINNIKSATLYFRLKDVTEVNDIRYPNRRRIILETPKQLSSSLTVNELEVEGHRAELMNLKQGDAVCLRGKIAYFKGGALGGLADFGDNPTLFTIGRAQSSCVYWSVNEPGGVMSRHIICMPKIGSTLQIGTTTWDVLQD